MVGMNYDEMCYYLYTASPHTHTVHILSIDLEITLMTKLVSFSEIKGQPGV